MKKSMIYIKIGDKGIILLVGGIWVLKMYIWFEVYGIVDELNFYLGLL